MEAHPTPHRVYQVAGWPEHFEGAKSKTYKNKSSCQMPTKHGLGYKRIIRRKNGPAIFGAWCAMVQVLSRHPAPREGYCTDTGRIEGNPYTPEELELLTDIDQKLFAELLEVASSQEVGWLRIPDGYQTDTAGVNQYPLDSDSDSDLNSDTDSDIDSPTPQADAGPPAITIPIIGGGEYPITQNMADEWESLYPAVDVMQTLREIRGWNLTNAKRRKTKNGVLKHVNAWLAREQNGGR